MDDLERSQTSVHSMATIRATRNRIRSVARLRRKVKLTREAEDKVLDAVMLCQPTFNLTLEDVADGIMQVINIDDEDVEREYKDAQARRSDQAMPRRVR